MRPVKLRFEEEATDELEEALDWYSARSLDAEAALADAVDEALTKILCAPNRFLRIPPSHRAFPATKFPYQIIYRIDGELIVIAAIAHTSRRPGYWKRRR